MLRTTSRDGWCVTITTQDVVQEAYLRALRFAGGFRGGDPRAWILAIFTLIAVWFRPCLSGDPEAGAEPCPPISRHSSF